MSMLHGICSWPANKFPGVIAKNPCGIQPAWVRCYSLIKSQADRPCSKIRVTSLLLQLAFTEHIRHCCAFSHDDGDIALHQAAKSVVNQDVLGWNACLEFHHRSAARRYHGSLHVVMHFFLGEGSFRINLIPDGA